MAWNKFTKEKFFGELKSIYLTKDDVSIVRDFSSNQEDLDRYLESPVRLRVPQTYSRKKLDKLAPGLSQELTREKSSKAGYAEIEIHDQTFDKIVKNFMKPLTPEVEQRIADQIASNYVQDDFDDRKMFVTSLDFYASSKSAVYAETVLPGASSEKPEVDFTMAYDEVCKITPTKDEIVPVNGACYLVKEGHTLSVSKGINDRLLEAYALRAHFQDNSLSY
jgi:hypothetical protein